MINSAEHLSMYYLDTCLSLDQCLLKSIYHILIGWSLFIIDLFVFFDYLLFDY